MPWSWRSVHKRASNDIDLPCALFVLHLRLSSAQHVGKGRWVGMTRVYCSRRECASRYADLSIFEELLAGLLALPLGTSSAITADGAARRLSDAPVTVASTSLNVVCIAVSPL